MEPISLILSSCLFAQAAVGRPPDARLRKDAVSAAAPTVPNSVAPNPLPAGASAAPPGAGIPSLGATQPSGLQPIRRSDAGTRSGGSSAGTGGNAPPGPQAGGTLGPGADLPGPTTLPGMNFPSLDPATQGPPSAATGADITAPAKSGARRELPTQLVAECLSLPPGGSASGRPLTLLAAISSTPDRRQQLEAVHAYWRLIAALAEYRLSFDEKAWFERVAGKPADAAMLRTARASSVATLRAAELALLAAQYDLAEAAALSATTPLPLPADLPHTGPYRTYFDELFASRAAPGRTRLLHRTLPIRQQAIETQASSVQAASDAMQATLEAYQAGEADWSACQAAVRQWGRQRRALIRAACDYNHDIADYAFAVAGPQVSTQALAAMLIKSASAPAPRPAAPKKGSSQLTPASGAEPAAFVEPAAQMPAGSAPPTGMPTLAPPPMVDPSDPPRDFVAPPNASPMPANGLPAGSSLRSIVIPAGAEAPRPVPTQSTAPAAWAPQGAMQRTAHRLVEYAGGARAAGPFYAALAGSSPAVRAKQLTVMLHTRQPQTAQTATSVDLKQSLQGVAAPDRRAVVDAFWLTRQLAAEYQVLVDQTALLEQLRSVALDRRADRGAAAAMLRLQAAVVASGAAQLRGQVKLLEAQFDLSRHAGRPLAAAWLLPVTVPHSGPYALQQDPSRAMSAEPWPARRPAATLPAWLADLQERAAATVEADAARAAAAAAYESGSGTLDRALAASQQQLDETLAFLETLTGYNRAIADYALSVLPASASTDQLVKTLVVVK